VGVLGMWTPLDGVKISIYKYKASGLSGSCLPAPKLHVQTKASRRIQIYRNILLIHCLGCLPVASI